MSHTSKIAGPAIRNIVILQAAVAAMAAQGIRCSLKENATPRAYFKDQAGMGKAPIVLELPDATYDIGFYLKEDGTYEPRTDFYNGSVAKCLGAKPLEGVSKDQAALGKLFQHYQAQATLTQARSQGLDARVMAPDAEGNMRILVTGFAG